MWQCLEISFFRDIFKFYFEVDVIRICNRIVKDNFSSFGSMV